MKARGRYLIQAAEASGAYLRFESPKGVHVTKLRMSDELRRIADLIDPRLTAEQKVRRWNEFAAGEITRDQLPGEQP